MACQMCGLSQQVTDDDGQLHVTVPVTDVPTGTTVQLQLACDVSGDEHQVAVESITDADGNPVTFDDATAERANRLIDFVARSELCGKPGVCPTAVVEAADELRQVA